MRQRAAEKCCMIGKRYGNYLFILYMVVKFCYIGIAVFQLYALNFVIGNGKTSGYLSTVYTTSILRVKISKYASS